MNGLASQFSVESPSAYLRTAVLALGVQSALALAYLAVTDAGLAAPETLAIPFVWITAAALGVRHAERPRSGRRLRVVAAAVGVGYALLLWWFTGAFGGASTAATGLDVVTLPPWWGPMLRYRGRLVSLFVFPYQAVGYAALAYLVSVAVRDVAASGASLGAAGVVALGSCAGCALPVVAAVGSVLGGVGVGVGSATVGGGDTYLIGTAAYVVAVAMLTVRPTVGRTR